MSVGSAQLFEALEKCRDRLALRVGDRALSGRDLARACAGHARLLERAGVRPGERVGVWTQRSIATPVALVGNAAYGAVSVPLDPSLGGTELEHVVGDADPRVVLAAEVDEVRDRTPGRDVLCAEVRLDEESRPPVRRVDDEPLLVLYTSGTTGLPKGAVLTARNVASNLDGLARAWAWTASDTIVHALPLFHVHGLVLGLFGAVRAGGALCWVPRFCVDGIAAALEEHPSACLFAVPTMHHRLADAAEQQPSIASALRGARLLVSGSAALPVREHERIERVTGRRVVERYGLTETLIDCAVPHDAPTPGYVGPPVPGVALRLVDDERRPLDRDDDETIGEVAVRGPNVFAGYLGRPDATAAVRDDEGWFYTGDLAARRPDGVVRIVGRRATDLIKTGGFKVGAGEVEGALLEHSAVAEVAVIGAPDPDLGERIVAFVVLREGASAPSAEVLASSVAGALSPHKRPREVRFLDALPRNAMGKVLKPSLRDLLGGR